ncbi:MAG: NFACT RNA binding domain-containing protein [Desulfotomaculaceae bacterium]|nr:NFACT RNA binding domain-containing protein [Desulfotomaculaceae bacterium]
MPFDGLVLAAVRQELEVKFSGARIEKIYQPEREELALVLHQPGLRQRLLLSAHARDARVHLTATSKENPVSAPLFCMVLRKHLEGGRILAFEQPGLERVLIIKIESRDELGRSAEKHLVCEIMGKHSNIILLNPDSGVILDGIRRYSHSVSRYREVLPGRDYLPPPAQGKLNPLALDEEKFRQICLDAPLETTLPNLLQKRLEGLSPVTCREIVHRANLPLDFLLDQSGDYDLRALWQALCTIIIPARKGEFEPCLHTGKKGDHLDFAALELSHTGKPCKHGGMNVLLDFFFTERCQQQKFSVQKNTVFSLLNKEISRLVKKVSIYTGSMDETAGADQLRLYGELLTANLYRLEKGLPEALLENYYDSTSPLVAVPLDPQLTPLENSRVYFKKYVKAKNTRVAVELRLDLAKEELSYLEGIKTALEQADSPAELDEIRQELTEQSYLKTPVPRPGTKKNKKKERHIPKPHSFRSSDDFAIFVGKNNKQNDYLTLKMAAQDDLWLHTKDIHGAHVIIRVEGREIPARTLEEASVLAAFFSKGRGSTKVAVDYTQVKHVHKPKGARPGMVIYEHQKTIMAAPDEEKVEILRTPELVQNDAQ